MPSHIPLNMLFGQCVSRCGSAMKVGFRALIASIVWLLLVPYVTMWAWRFYFLSSEGIVDGISGRQPPSLSSNASTPADPSLLDYNLRKFLVDCLEGQAITLLIIVVVVLAYLFREWVVQNTPVGANLGYEFEQDDSGFTGDIDIDIHSNETIQPITSSKQKVTVDTRRKVFDDGDKVSLEGNDGISIRKLQQLPKQNKRQETRNQRQHQFTSSIEYDFYRLSNDEEDEAQIESMMQSIMVKDPANALKRYSWDDLQNSNGTTQQTTTEPAMPSTLIRQALDQGNSIKNRRPPSTTTTLEYGLDRMDSSLFSRGQCNLTSTTWTDLYMYPAVENQFPTGLEQYTDTQTLSRRHSATNHDEDILLEASISIASLRSPSQLNGNHQPPLSLQHQDLEGESIFTGRLEDQQYGTAEFDNHDDQILELFDINDENFQDDEDHDVFNLGNDIDDLLEAIGVRGDPWVLLQNSVLACILMILFLALVIWIPYILGCLITLARPIDFVQNLLNALQYTTDPALDYILDHHLPSRAHSLICLLAPENLILVGGSLLTAINTAMGPLLNAAFINGKWAPSLSFTLYNIHHPTSDSIVSEIDGTTLFMERQSTLVQQSMMDVKYYMKLSCTCIDRFVQRWHQLAVGKSGIDRAMCIMVGYIVLLSIGSWYLARQHHHQHSVHGVKNSGLHRSTSGIQEFIRQQVIFFKVFLFVALELILLPVICGILLNLATLPLIENATVSTRWTFVMTHPYCGCFLHWFVGTGFMFHFAVFVTLSREIVRPGVMWFIRDPNDPQFHPVQEIMERPLLLLLRKLCTGVLIYLAMIVVGMGTVIWCVSQYTGISHIRWAFHEPLSTLAIDMLAAQFLIPPLVAYIKPRDFAKRILLIWWRAVSCRLRLSSFMFGGRYQQEESGSYSLQIWKHWLMRNMPFVSAADPLCLSTEGDCSRDKISCKLDGQLVRVPKHDSVMLPTRRRMIVPVDPITLEPIDPIEKHLGHPASISENGNEEHNTTIVYIPPHFKIRVGVFLFLMWLSGSVTTCSVTVAPLLLGRTIFEIYLTPGKKVHDFYALVLGAYTMVLFSVFFNWIARGWDYYLKRHILGGWRILIEKAWTSLRKKVLTGLKAIYLTVTIGWMIPLLVGVMVDLYVFMPIRYSKSPHQAIVLHLSKEWSFGVLYLGILYGIIHIFPTNTWRRTLDLYVSSGLAPLKILTLTRTTLGPWIVGTACAILFPGVMAWTMIKILDVQDVNVKLMMFRCAYPIIFCILVILGIALLGIKLVTLWIQSIRDDTYLVGKQLHNLDQRVSEHPC